MCWSEWQELEGIVQAEKEEKQARAKEYFNSMQALTLTLVLTLTLNGCQPPPIHHNSLILNSCELTHIGVTDTQ